MSMQSKGRAIAVAVLVFVLTLTTVLSLPKPRHEAKPLVHPVSVVAMERTVEENGQKREAIAALDKRLAALTVQIKRAEKTKATTERKIVARQTEAQRLAEKAARLHNDIARLEKQLSRLRQRLAVQHRAAVVTRRAAPTDRSIAAVKAYARAQVGDYQFQFLDRLWTKESGWLWNADNPTSDAYGIPQSLPGSKMASAGADWRTNPYTQVRWGLGYIRAVYGTPEAAWAHSVRTNWY